MKTLIVLCCLFVVGCGREYTVAGKEMEPNHRMVSEILFENGTYCVMMNSWDGGISCDFSRRNK